MWHLRHEARVSALDVEELLHADISTETGLGHTESICTDKL